jgi:putative ABC transport system permease protein
MSGWKQDVRFAFRVLIKAKGFSAAVLLTLALGIGLNSCIFNIFHSVLVQDLPFGEPDRLVAIWSTLPDKHAAVVGSKRNTSSHPNFLDWKEQNHVFDGISAIRASRLPNTASGSTEPEQVETGQVCEGFFEVLGVQAAVGRCLSTGDYAPGQEVVVLSHRYWRRRFGSNPAAIGQSLLVDQVPHTVVGVLPPDFRFAITFAPYGIDNEPDLWRPYRPGSADSSRGNNILFPIGRLKAGVTIQQAETEMKLIAARLGEQYPNTNAGFGLELVGLHESMRGRHRTVLAILLAAAGLVLLVACVNVANLMLSRSTYRSREFALRTSMGATKLRIARQLLTEGLIYAIFGGGLGLALALLGGRLVDPFLRSVSKGLPNLEVNLQMVMFGFTVSLVTALFFSLAPILRIARSDVSESLKAGAKGVAGPVGRQPLASALVVAQVALALVLLIGAGLLFRSLAHLLQTDPGFQPDRLIAVQVPLAGPLYNRPEIRSAFYERLLEKALHIPGVESAALSGSLPSSLSGNMTFRVEGGEHQSRVPEDASEIPNADYSVVTPDYFHTVGIPLVQGRLLSSQDSEKAPPVIVINQTMARKYWNGEAIGQIIFLGRERLTIVGIVRDGRQRGLRMDPAPHMYRPHSQAPRWQNYLLVRAKVEPAALFSALRTEVRSLDPGQFVGIRMVADELSASLASPRLILWLLGAFAALALVLASLGIYSLVSYSVSQTKRDIGIRMALGATRLMVLKMVLKYGLLRAAAGVVLGIGIASAVTRFLTSLLFGITPGDPWTYAGVSLVLVLSAVTACYIPASRAAALQPMQTLKCD